MPPRRTVPNLYTDDPAALRAFYEGVLGFETAMDLGWIVTLVSPGRPEVQLSVLRGDPSGLRPALSVEVPDVDAAHAAAREMGARIAYGPQDEPWGVRRFFLLDPTGVLVNVVGHR